MVISRLGVDELYSSEYKDLLKIAGHRLRFIDAEDALHDSYVMCIVDVAAEETTTTSKSLGHWVGTRINRAVKRIQSYNKTQREYDKYENEGLSEFTLEETLEGEVRREGYAREFINVFKGSSDQRKDIIRMRVEMDMPWGDISKELDIPVTTCHSSMVAFTELLDRAVNKGQEV